MPWREIVLGLTLIAILLIVECHAAQPPASVLVYGGSAAVEGVKIDDRYEGTT